MKIWTSQEETSSSCMYPVSQLKTASWLENQKEGISLVREIEVLPFDQDKYMVDGSRKVVKRNRKLLKPITRYLTEPEPRISRVKINQKVLQVNEFITGRMSEYGSSSKPRPKVQSASLNNAPKAVLGSRVLFPATCIGKCAMA